MARGRGCSMLMTHRWRSNMSPMACRGCSDEIGSAAHTHIVSKAGLGGAAASGAVLPLARVSDGGGATRAAVCQRQPRGLGAEQVTRAPKNTRRESEDAYVYIENTRDTASAQDRGAWGRYPGLEHLLPQC